MKHLLAPKFQVVRLGDSVVGTSGAWPLAQLGRNLTGTQVIRASTLTESTSDEKDEEVEHEAAGPGIE